VPRVQAHAGLVPTGWPQRKPYRPPSEVRSLAAPLVLIAAACTAGERGDDRAPTSAPSAMGPKATKAPEKSRLHQMNARVDGSVPASTPQTNAPAADAGTNVPPLAPSSTRRLPVGEPRVYAKTRNVWIRGKPTNQTQWIGFLWWGDSLPLREPDPIAGPGCATFYAVEPRGYVCVDGKRATLDPDDPVVKG